MRQGTQPQSLAMMAWSNEAKIYREIRGEASYHVIAVVDKLMFQKPDLIIAMFA